MLPRCHPIDHESSEAVFAGSAIPWQWTRAGSRAYVTSAPARAPQEGEESIVKTETLRAAGPLQRGAVGFVVAALAVPTFHAFAWWVVHQFGMMPPPFPMAPTKPFGVPVILSLTFWAAVLYGIPFGLLLPRLRGPLVLWGLGLGVVACLVGWLVVAPIKGVMPVGGSMIIPLVLNGTWGIGVALMSLLLPWRNRPRAAPAA